MLARMFRLRRYRVFLAVAAIFTFLGYRLFKQKQYLFTNEEPIIPSDGFSGTLAPPPKNNEFPAAIPAKKTSRALLPAAASTRKAALASITKPSIVEPTSTKAQAGIVPIVPALRIPERKLPPLHGWEEETYLDDIHPVVPDGKQEYLTLKDAPIFHYEKLAEHFPVPTESIIPLPTGPAAKIPKIQFAFDDETRDAKINREKRQTHVREQFKKAWDGYRKFAWMHDEVRPVSGTFRDPFCGWAATLVDSLDTLWMMGYEEEFEVAVNAVKKIDFTTTKRSEIPVFETTIRYLGGLLAAYDVSGGKFQALLDKAVELGDVLIGTFDTPNRMPELYYRWKPAFVSQPHRASMRSNLAELGSLSLEFTRLAQLTKEARFYDAVARVSIALGEYQDRGTVLGGIFPDNVDASGCNKTATPVTLPLGKEKPLLVDPATSEGSPEGYKPALAGSVPEHSPNKNPSQAHMLQMDVVNGEPSKAQIAGWDDPNVKKRAVIPKENETAVAKISSTTIAPGLKRRPARQERGYTDIDWDCVPQGIDSATQGSSDKFSMAGGQDSTYEYFPKQWLLLGGREDLHRKMYLETIKAIKKHLLFKPMLPNNPDILFTGSIGAYTEMEQAQYVFSGDVEHLTCFIGGMVGMAAKIFELEEDLEIAKRLADGCVWAYGNTPTGIMPEAATVLPCQDAAHCTWNETIYYRYMDPQGKLRDTNLKTWLAEQQQGDLESGVGGRESLDGSYKKTKRDALPSSPKPQSPSVARAPADPPEVSFQEKFQAIQADLDEETVGRESKTLFGWKSRPSKTFPDPTKPVSQRPLSHKEYVDKQIAARRFPPGIVTMQGEAYHLRPEAIESIWYMYRITGDPIWQDKGWNMYKAVIAATATENGHSAIFDVTVEEPSHTDETESFWLSETLKYFYLLFSTPDTISLDEWVLNTEAHPFRREKA
ncbi:glycosyl hydrolase family 47-domain-containing protein [Calycina marina]|uniref:alpha-1,2-Mannosidase n=1 Tax=Calycina marina TaxID=1763456 RepID=A0A9P7YZW8_9HELO|nr:glycosyl hydrolase family 47-domain-containing protein [Calycina marina]